MVVVSRPDTDPNGNVYVYMLRCRDGTLYTGITNDVKRRLVQHCTGQGSKYLRGRGPFELVYIEKKSTRADALKREIEIKRLPKEAKTQLLERHRAGSIPLPDTNRESSRYHP